jgi:hypothetical protein
MVMVIRIKNEIKFTCKIGKMKKVGKIIWIPKRFQEFFGEDSYVEIIMRKLK